MNKIKLSVSQKDQYDRDGYLIIRNFLDPEEVALLYGLATNDDALTDNAWDFNDQSGKRTKLTFGLLRAMILLVCLSRSESMVSAIQALLGEGEVCHFHSKLMQKEPKVGGAWEWHQDYGYWYKNGFLYPGCTHQCNAGAYRSNQGKRLSQVLKGSHKMGRFEHNFVGEQQGADMPFVEEALKICERVYVELNPGDVLFFHSNVLHMSEANLSDKPRWSFISAYNLSYNVPFREKSTSCITPLKTVPDEAILAQIQ